MLRRSSACRLNLELRHGVVAVRVRAHAVVVEQPVPVAELDALRDEYMG
jgi:hypothetical protein